VDGDLSVNKLLFLNRERLLNKTSAHLISSGPWGMIHFWTIFSGSGMIAKFPIVNFVFSIFYILKINN
jgi:hypothetical protein